MRTTTRHHATTQARGGARGTRRRGFTLFELVLVVLILGIIAAALVPPLGRNLSSPRLRTAANMLASDLDFCASECIAQPDDPYAVTFDTVQNRYSVIDFDAAAPVNHPGDGLTYVNDFETGRNVQISGVRLQSVTAGGNPVGTISFDAYGRPLLSADLIITLAFNSQTLTVRVSSTTGDVTITGG